ncbi:MAG: DUF4859 domain-containing protein [Paludibacteraceae bacterium]|nr:DUF4859 domain-containing protein [Paludibacteraceae bacterium]
MRKTLLLLTTLLSMSFSMTLSAQKSIYIPKEWQNRKDTLIYSENDPGNQYTWSKSRSKESENFIVFWDKNYGNTNPTNASWTYSVDIDDLLEKCEGFYAMNVGKLAFCDESQSNVSKYKLLILLNHTTEWVCYGGGYDDVIGALWLSPSTSKPVGFAVGHEVGHSFQYQVYADLKGYSGFRTAIGSGSTFWEQTAQWQSSQSFPDQKWNESWGLFKNTHNYAMTHEWHRYQSYWWHYYLAETYGIDAIGKLWRYNPGFGADPNESFMKMNGMNAADLYMEYFQYAMKMATMDIDNVRDEAGSYISTLRYDYVALGGAKYQVTYSSCPQSTGFNIIRLNVPKAGTEISTDFTSLANGAPLPNGDAAQYFNGEKFTAANVSTYNKSSNYSNRGFHLGYVALMKDGSRRYLYEDEVYCAGVDASKEASCVVGCVVPEGVDKLFLVVSPAPSEYIQHKWDEIITNDDQWPYTVEFRGTNLFGAAEISDTIPMSDVEIAYDVYFPASASVYQAVNINVDGTAASMLGTALQLKTSALGSVLRTWKSEGPSDGQAMFYAVNSDGSIVNMASSANGYGHWFSESGNRCDYASGYVFSEFDAGNLSFSLGQYPGKLSNGSNYTIRQAIVYKKNGQTAIAKFVFNIHITASKTGYVLRDGGTTGTEAVSQDVAYPVAYYTVSGIRIPSLQRGVNLVKMSDGSVRKLVLKQ